MKCNKVVEDRRMGESDTRASRCSSTHYGIVNATTKEARRLRQGPFYEKIHIELKSV